MLIMKWLSLQQTTETYNLPRCSHMFPLPWDKKKEPIVTLKEIMVSCLPGQRQDGAHAPDSTKHPGTRYNNARPALADPAVDIAPTSLSQSRSLKNIDDEIASLGLHMPGDH